MKKSLLIPLVFLSGVSMISADIISNLALHYAFENAGSLGTDSSGNGLTGLVNGGAAGTVDAERGNVLSLTGGADGNIEVAIPINAGAFTLATWVKADTFFSNRGLFQVQNGGTTLSTTTKVVGGWVNASGQPWGRVIESGGSARSLPQTGPSISSGAGAQWHHVAYVGDGSTYSVFLDGSNAGTASIAYDGTLQTHTHLFIGRQANESWNGQLDDFRVYDRALSPGDISELMAIPEPGSATLLIVGLLSVFCFRRKDLVRAAKV